jgi:hypothetical protein
MNFLVKQSNTSASDIFPYLLRNAQDDNYTRSNHRKALTFFDTMPENNSESKRYIEYTDDGFIVSKFNYNRNWQLTEYKKYNNENQLMGEYKYSYNNDGNVIESINFQYDNNEKVIKYVHYQYYNSGKISNELVRENHIDGRFDYQYKSTFSSLGNKATANFIKANYSINGYHRGYSEQHAEFDTTGRATDYRKTDYDTQGNRLLTTPVRTIPGSHQPIGNISSELVREYNSRFNYQNKSTFIPLGNTNTEDFMKVNYNDGHHSGYSEQHAKFDIIGRATGYRKDHYDIQGNRFSTTPARTIPGSRNSFDNMMGDTNPLISAMNNFPTKAFEHMRFTEESPQKSMTNVFAPLSHSPVHFSGM